MTFALTVGQLRCQQLMGSPRNRSAGIEDVDLRPYQGAQVGTDRSDVWFQVGTGLPVRNRRTISAATDTPVGSSTYTEVGEFQLAATEAL